MHHLLQEANYTHLQLCVQLKVLRTHVYIITEVLFVSFKDIGGGGEGQKHKEKEKRWTAPVSAWRPSDAAHSGLCWWQLFG